MTTAAPKSTAVAASAFDLQRAALLEDVVVGMENVLQKINRLNRNLEGIIAVGTELGQVESLWSQFEGVMAKDVQEQHNTAPKDEPVTENQP